MAHSTTYRQIVKASERVSFIPGGIRRAAAAVLTAFALGGMFVSPGVLIGIPLNVVYAATKGGMPQWAVLVSIFGMLLGAAVMLVFTVIGVIRYCESRHIEDMAYTLGFAFWTVTAIFIVSACVPNIPNP